MPGRHALGAERAAWLGRDHARAGLGATVSIDAATVEPHATVGTAVAAVAAQRDLSPPPPRRRVSSDPPPPAKAEGAWRTEIDILRREAEALRDRDPPRAALFYGAMAQIATSVMADPSDGGAAGSHAAIAALARQRLGARALGRAALRRDAATQLRWDRALELARGELPLVGDPHERVALLLEIATIEELVAGDLAHARIALEEAREIDPANAAVLEALAEIYLVAGDWDKLVTALSSMADATSDVDLPLDAAARRRARFKR